MFLKSFHNLVPQILFASTRRRCFPLALLPVSRFICDRAYLKLDSYEEEKKKFVSRVVDKEAFWLRLLSLKNVYEEDLKAAWYISEEGELSTIIELSEKYFQEKSVFSTFKFGSVMMRTCHYFNKPEIALEIFRNPTFIRVSDDAMTVILLLDLLIETGKFEEASSIYEFIYEREWYFVLKHPLIPMLYTISLYKQGTKEAYLKAQQCCKKLYVNPTYKIKVETIVAGFALKMKDPNTAVTLMHRKAIDSELAFNIKIQGHVMQSEWDKVMKDIKYIKYHRIYKDTLQLILNSGLERAAIRNLKSLDITVEEKLMSPVALENNKATTPIKKKFYN